jgi:hypothetical protein
MSPVFIFAFPQFLTSNKFNTGRILLIVLVPLVDVIIISSISAVLFM